MKKSRLFKEEIFSKFNRYQLQWKKISYSKFKIGINYNEENKLFKVQNSYPLQ